MEGNISNFDEILRIGVNDPLAAVARAFEESSSSSGSGVEFGERALFERIMGNVELARRVPYLTKSTLISGVITTNSLIRYRGMVHDIFNTEYYVGVGVETNRKTGEKRRVSSKYRDAVEVSNDEFEFDFDSPDVKTMERTAVLLVPVPGESSWVREYNCAATSALLPSVPAQQLGSSTGNRKRGLDGVEDCSHAMQMEDGAASIEEPDSRKKVTVSASSSSSSSSSTSTSTSSSPPAPPCAFLFDHEVDICCLAKMYDSGHDTFRLNDVIEVVGVCTMDYAAASAAPPDEGSLEHFLDPALGMQFDVDLLPPTSIAPRLHCITFRRIGSSFPLFQPLLSDGEGSSGRTFGTVVRGAGVFACQEVSSPLSLFSSKSLDSVRSARAVLLVHLTAALGGDATAAEYLLLALLSRVVSRTETVLLGYFPLVISGLQQNDGHKIGRLQHILSRFVPRCVTFGADIDTLNRTTVQPQKDYDLNRITPSPLQVGSGTVLLVDETKLEEGKLTENGVRSASALRNLALNQTLSVSFTYCEVSVPLDSPLIFFTSSSRSSLYATQETARVHLAPADDAKMSVAEQEQGDEEPEPEQGSVEWQDLKAWWAALRLQDVSMDADTIQAAEDDFVSARQSDDTLTLADFHSWLTVARLLALSLGETKITKEVWTRMRDLELRRRRSNASCPTSS